MAFSALTVAISGAIEGIGTGLWATGVNAQLGSASGDDLVLAGLRQPFQEPVPHREVSDAPPLLIRVEL